MMARNYRVNEDYYRTIQECNIAIRDSFIEQLFHSDRLPIVRIVIPKHRKDDIDYDGYFLDATVWEDYANGKRRYYLGGK